MARLRYLGRLSGPLLDRVDLRIEMRAATRADLRGGAAAPEGTAVVAERVAVARDRMAARLAGTPWRVNAEVPGHVLRRLWRLPWEVVGRPSGCSTVVLTARGVDRVVGSPGPGGPGRAGRPGRRRRPGGAGLPRGGPVGA
jgi:magnesium chelatase family protein